MLDSLTDIFVTEKKEVPREKRARETQSEMEHSRG